MRRIHILLLTVLLFTVFTAKSQDKRVLFTINNEPVTVEEFLSVFNKNNTNAKQPTEKEVREYLELFKKFKMKVKEAYVMGLDTNPDFKNELGMYRKQLAQPYLTDKETTEKVVQEVYDRMKVEVKASHILVRCAEDASPKDTMAAWNRIQSIYANLKKGANFADVARESSEDPSAKDNSGSLGYFSAMRMIYPFENVCYNTPVGQISQPFRTQFGYHIVKVDDKRPSNGEIRTAHIIVLSKDTDVDSVKANAKRKIDEIYNRAIKGEKFEELAKEYSDDNATAPNGGQLPWFGTGRMVQEFEEAAFSIPQDGGISKPVKTMYGWHIIKRLEKKGLQPFDQIKQELEQKVSRDSRSFLNKQLFVNKLKKAYKFTEMPKVKTETIAVIAKDTTFGTGGFKADQYAKLNKELFRIDSSIYKQTAFIEYVAANQPIGNIADNTTMLNKIYDQFVEKTFLDFEDSRLETKYVDFRNLIKEYTEGILLFDLTDKNVWTKAIEDTLGLDRFYQINKNNYMYSDRLDCTIYTCADSKIASKVRKMIAKGATDEEMLTKMNKENPLNLRIQNGKFEKSNVEVLAKVEWKKGLSPNVISDKSTILVNVKDVLKPEPKPLNEVRGLVTSDYQNYLETAWLQSLTKKYAIKVNEDVLKTLWK